MITLHQTTQGSDEWKQDRVGKFTGSNAYKLLGSFGANAYAQAINDSFTGNYHTKRGHILEDEAIELYSIIKKTAVDRPGYVTNSDYPSCLYSPDGIDGDYLLEVKCFIETKHMNILNGSIPLHVLAQIHFGMLICGKKKARLIIYNPDIDAHHAFHVTDIKYNRAIATNFKRILAPAKVV
jgi:hypothetical protein